MAVPGGATQVEEPGLALLPPTPRPEPSSPIEGEPVVSAIVHQDPSEGMGTTNFATEIVANDAVLDRDRQKKLMDYTGTLDQQQRTHDLKRRLP
jgi:hypothetical protein